MHFLIASAGAAERDTVDFDRDILPILSDKCFACHGPDAAQRQAELRLDQEEAAKESVIVPGEAAASELFARISADDPDLRMPPPDSKLTLQPAEIERLRRWIDQGAPWSEHWAFTRPSRPPIPSAGHQWARTPIDGFVARRLEELRLAVAPEADRETLIRRVTFDLTGLPPTVEEIEAFLQDTSPNAYERLVDRLLQSPRFGERLAVDWLDAARYADTYGYQNDLHRDVWPYRDWVIDAFNHSLPYDDFLTWQLAGDLLPGATRAQIIATAFNRLHRQTNEGGSIEEEFRTEYVADRVNTLGVSILGLTLECARCHDHKYDPITQEEYYRLFAFFNNIDESGLYSHFTDAVPTPTLRLTTSPQAEKIRELEQAVAAAQQKLEEIETAPGTEEAFQSWLASAAKAPHLEIPGLAADYPFETLEGGELTNRADETQPAKLIETPQLQPGKIGNGLLLSGEDGISTLVGGDLSRDDPFSIALWIRTPQSFDRAVILHRSRAWTDSGSRGYELLVEEGRLSAALIHFWPGNAVRVVTQEAIPTNEWVHVVVAYDGSSRAKGLSIFINGEESKRRVVRDKLEKNIHGGAINGGDVDSLVVGNRFRDRGFAGGMVDELQIFRRKLTPLEVAGLYDGNAMELVRRTAEDRASDDDVRRVRRYYLHVHHEAYRQALATLHAARRSRSAVADAVPELMVMREMSPRRPTYLLERGAYDAPGRDVAPGTPASLPEMPADWPQNRLGLARWLTMEQHPLTARVAVNRCWQMMFGRGLVVTAEDFGRQGQAPSHPELLDWLATEFVESGWDVKRLLRQIALSATYRQGSAVAPQIRSRDPENVWLARGPSHRWSAEMLRDAALASGGLLVEHLGGPSVKPYQPPGLWEEKSGAKYARDEGAGSHRRSLYTYWKRTSPPPAMLTFDATAREVCVARRQTTTTPPQALVLLNDPQYVETARGLAQSVLRRAGSGEDEQLQRVFRTMTGRQAASRELELLRRLYREQYEQFSSSLQDAAAFLSIGDHRADPEIEPARLAALTVVVQMLQNYDEAVTKR